MLLVLPRPLQGPRVSRCSLSGTVSLGPTGVGDLLAPGVSRNLLRGSSLK